MPVGRRPVARYLDGYFLALDFKMTIYSTPLLQSLPLFHVMMLY